MHRRYAAGERGAERGAGGAAMKANAIQAHEAREQAMQQAARIYPHSPYLQAEWLRALNVVRATAQGYVLDKFITKGAGREQ
jgi:hypothetical protein